MGIILKGRVNIIKEDYWGNRTILTTLSTGDLFGESFVCTNINNNCFSIVTAEKAEIMFLNYQKITSPCQFACNFHSKIIQNMLLLIAKKNIQLTTKIDHLSKKQLVKKSYPIYLAKLKNIIIPLPFPSIDKNLQIFFLLKEVLCLLNYHACKKIN